MRKKRDDENGDRIGQFGSYTGPAVVTIVALVAVIVMILVSSSSPRVGIATVGVMLLAVFRNCRNSVPAHRVTVSKL